MKTLLCHCNSCLLRSYFNDQLELTNSLLLICSVDSTTIAVAEMMLNKVKMKGAEQRELLLHLANSFAEWKKKKFQHLLGNNLFAFSSSQFQMKFSSVGMKDSYQKLDCWNFFAILIRNTTFQSCFLLLPQLKLLTS